MSIRAALAGRDDLLAWANTVPAQTEFPRLLRRLVMETCPGAASLGFPAGSGAALGQWDGSVRTTVGNAFVPDGLSVWELSVGKNITSKAESDYAKRTTTPDGSPTKDCVYIQAILRPWEGRDEWATGKQADRRWKTVRAYGVDDVDTWLESAPVTHAWISELLGLGPHGYRAAEAWWRSWTETTSPHISPALVLAGRDEAVANLTSRLDGPPQIISIKGGSREDTVAFVTALLRKRADDGFPRSVARAALVDEVASWRALAQRTSPLILVAANEAVAAESQLAGPHHVLIPVFGGATPDVELPPINSDGAATVLIAGGLDETKARGAGHLARRSLVALRRHLAVKPELITPPWGRTPTRTIRGLLLAGAWRDDASGDRAVIAGLGGSDYESVTEEVAILAAADDPLVSRLGQLWMLVSSHDAWIQLRGGVRPDDLARFEQVAAEVLLEVDPALELRPEDRWRANLDGKVRAYSSELRAGIAASLAMIGLHGSALETTYGGDGQQFADIVVRRILDAANADRTGKIWNSIADLLSALAEASPDVFLNAILAGSSGNDPVLLKLFSDHEDASLFGSSSRHSELLWALERLAWSPDHLGQVVLALSRLSQIDPGGRLSNRPFASLSGILTPWHPETGAAEPRRLATVDAVRKRYSDIGWRLLLDLLPSMRDVHTRNPEPAYRSWKDDYPPDSVTMPDWVRFTSNLVDRALEDAGSSVKRWHEVLDKMSDLPPADRARLIEQLATVIQSGSLDGDAAELWDELRAFVAKHREYSDAQWALPESELKAIDPLIASLAPEDPVAAGSWIFREYMPHVAAVSWRDDHQAHDDEVRRMRNAVVQEVEQASGLEGCLRLAGAALSELSVHVGLALAEVAEEKYRDELLLGVGGADAVLANVAWGWLIARYKAFGWDWIEAAITNGELSDSQKARVLLATRDYPRAWERAAALGPDVNSSFWNMFTPYGLGPEFDQVEKVVDELLQQDRAVAAIKLLTIYGNRSQTSHVDEVLQVLHAFLSLQDKDPDHAGLDQHDLRSMFEYLNASPLPEKRSEVAQLEWAYLPVLGFEPELGAIQDALVADPSFFVQLLGVVYRPQAGTDDSATGEQDELEPSSADLLRLADNAYRLLGAFDRLPGLRDDGVVDGSILTTWTDEVLRLAGEVERIAIAEERVGAVLANSPSDADGTWPCEAVRETIERLDSPNVDSGFIIAVLSSRGVTTRALDAGGTQEHELAERYRRLAEAVADQWPRTASALRSLSTSYESDARREERSAERFRRGIGY